jgi:hypothetical protein
LAIPYLGPVVFFFFRGHWTREKRKRMGNDLSHPGKEYDGYADIRETLITPLFKNDADRETILHEAANEYCNDHTTAMR